MSTVETQAIQKTPNVQGGDACIRTTRIPVWLLVGYRKDGVDDARLLEMYPSLTLVDLSAAWWYYAEHREEIEQAIREQEEA
jgi:uncharacterized protein (DUF433 family)